MNPESPAPDRDALALIAGIERASRRSRPFFLFGLLAVILGFVSVAVYLYQDREEERAQKAVLEKQVGELSGTLKRARALLPELEASQAARDQLRVLLGQASATARALPAAVAAAESATPTPAPAPPAARTPAPSPRAAPADPATPGEAAQPQAAPPPPAERTARNVIRINIYISDPSQFGPARELEWSLRGDRLGGFTIGEVRVVRGNGRGSDNLLVCQTIYDCERADAVAEHVNSLLVSPRLGVRGIGTVDNSNLGLFEIWLAPGRVRLVAF